ncbi:hypothetical protein FB567DRAFT_552952 [Paraphoma chrysanthemicola]|uniref:Secreted protein n=1 Tax=Paraphoma chrysanthemicola TaxID=798071 RepID=A0A8K0VUA4_9PLEO|nr:hypothetical protein FB567DRAFT_552952 [Paraphoma chrysanthemicola]
MRSSLIVLAMGTPLLALPTLFELRDSFASSKPEGTPVLRVLIIKFAPLTEKDLVKRTPQTRPVGAYSGETAASEKVKRTPQTRPVGAYSGEAATSDKVKRIPQTRPVGAYSGEVADT